MLLLVQINFEEVEMKTPAVNLDEIAQASMQCLCLSTKYIWVPKWSSRKTYFQYNVSKEEIRIDKMYAIFFFSSEIWVTSFHKLMKLFEIAEGIFEFPYKFPYSKCYINYDIRLIHVDNSIMTIIQ